jgi:hypothetical protein
MRITSKISHYHKGFLALLLAPFLWLQMYFHALQEWLLEILYNELFTLNKVHYSQTTHFLSIVCFSIFSLLAYHQQIDQYISLILYSLWLINFLCAKFRTGLYVDNPAWVKLETHEQHWQWSLLIKNKCETQQNFDYSQIKCVLIAAATYGDDSFRNQVLQIWHVHIQTKDEQQWAVYQNADIQQALLKAVELAEQLNTHVKIAESFGTGALAEVDLGVHNRAVVAWRRAFISDTVRLYKNFSTLSIFRWIKMILQELGDFIFIAVLAGCMQRYGLFLMVFFGRNLGLAPPSSEVLENNSIIVTPFAPEFDWIMLTTFVVTMLVLLHGIYKQNRKYEILMNHQRVQYRIAGELKGSLNFTQRPDYLLLKGFDKTSLIIVNEQYKLLEIKDLEEDEYDELYEMLLTA